MRAQVIDSLTPGTEAYFAVFANGRVWGNAQSLPQRRSQVGVNAIIRQPGILARVFEDVILSEAVFQAERRISRGARKLRARSLGSLVKARGMTLIRRVTRAFLSGLARLRN